VGRIEGAGTGGVRRFVAIAGAGFDSRTAQTVNSGIRYLSGPAAYVLGAIVTALDFRPFQLTITTDGATRELAAMFVSIANTPTTGGGMRIAPDARIDDGYLDICLVGAVPNGELLWQLTNVFKGAHVHHPAVCMLRARSVRLSADPPQPLLIDGEVCGTTPATIQLDRHALAVKAPPWT
jgi:diacylglycerol kinase (ATP)